MEHFEIFCWQLSAAIKRSGLSRAELATRLGLKPATVKSWCVGRRAPTVRRLLELTDLLQIDPRLLFEAPANIPRRMTCPACGQGFSRKVGYRIHVALKAKDDPRHAQLDPRAVPAEPASRPMPAPVAVGAGVGGGMPVGSGLGGARIGREN
jgi:transcriptional regulator with XRE-family HTH domain